MAAYRRVDDLTVSYLRADCLYTGISSGPNAQYRVWEAFTFTFTFSVTVVPKFIVIEPCVSTL